jgi:hypothetical protein
MNADLLRILSQQPLGTHLIPEQYVGAVLPQGWLFTISTRRLIDFMDDLPVIHETELGELGHKGKSITISLIFV